MLYLELAVYYITRRTGHIVKSKRIFMIAISVWCNAYRDSLVQYREYYTRLMRDTNRICNIMHVCIGFNYISIRDYINITCRSLLQRFTNANHNSCSVLDTHLNICCCCCCCCISNNCASIPMFNCSFRTRQMILL